MWQRPPDRKIVEGAPQPDLAIREGNFKMLINTDSTEAEFYDISKDEAETKNVSAHHPEVVKALSDKVFTWHASMPATK